MSQTATQEHKSSSGADVAATVAVVIPTYNNLRLLMECLQAVRGLSYPREKLEIIVVDNGSTDGTARMLAGRHPHVRCISLEKNTGFAVACNRGAAEASSEYVAFLNDDAVPERGWIEGLLAGLRAGGEDALCAASHIRSRDGSEVEYAGASANLFGVGRPRPTWGWLDSPEKPVEGSPVLFASGGAMLIHRRTFLDVGGFDPHFFAYFEDVDLGWRLWALGHPVVYAPAAVVRHIGGATGSRSPAHRRYTLWECNSLATILKNYEGGNMERILSTGLMLLYKRAVLSAGEAFRAEDYQLTAPRDTNTANIEHLPKVSVAHLAAINRFNSLLPYFMEERRRIQSARKRSDAEIFPLLGRPLDPQFAGEEYAQAMRALAHSMQLYGLLTLESKNRALIVAPASEEAAATALAARITPHALVALAITDGSADDGGTMLEYGFTRHAFSLDDSSLRDLVRQADAILLYGGSDAQAILEQASAPVAFVGTDRGDAPPGVRVFSADDPDLVQFCIEPTNARSLTQNR